MQNCNSSPGFFTNITGEANEKQLDYIHSFVRCSSRYCCSTISSSRDIPYRGSNDGVFPGSNSILKSWFSRCGASLLACCFSKVLIISWSSSEMKSHGSTYVFGFNVFLMSFMMTAKISWSCFLCICESCWMQILHQVS